MSISNNQLAKKRHLKLSNGGYESCNLSLYESPLLRIIEGDYGPSIDTSDEVEDIYNNFVKTMEENFSDQQLITMHNNIKSLKINESIIPFIASNVKRFVLGDKKSNIVSHYSIVDNSFVVNATKNIKYKKQSMNQELLYMSSSCIHEELIYNNS